MCYELDHICNYCSKHYHCDLPNELCPTINFDIDKFMCSACKKQLEYILKNGIEVPEKFKGLVK